MESYIKELIPEKNSADLELLMPVYLRIWNHPDNLKFLSFTGCKFTESQLQQWCSNHLSMGIRYDAVYDSDEKISGLLLCKADPLTGFELFSIGIDPDRKRKGLGRMLIRHGIERAMALEYASIDGQVFCHNKAMLCLLISMGFVPVRLDHHRGPCGEDLLHLKKYLQP